VVAGRIRYGIDLSPLWRARHALIGASVVLLGAAARAQAPAQRPEATLAQLAHRTWTARDGAPVGIQTLAQTRDGFLWLGGSTGLFRFDGVRFERYEPPPGQATPSNLVGVLHAVPDGTLWVGYMAAGGVSAVTAGYGGWAARPRVRCGWPRHPAEHARGPPARPTSPSPRRLASAPGRDAEWHIANASAAPPLVPMTIRVLTADDHLVVRAGLAALIATEPGIEVIGEARDGREAVEQYAALRPDVVLMDLRMPGMDGIAATQAIRRDDPQARVIVITMYEGDVDIHRALAAGAIGYLLKDVPAAELTHAIRHAAAGRRALPAAVARALADHTPRVDLTAREVEVLRLVAKGLQNSEVARLIGRTTGTVKVHLQHIFQKLGTEDRTEAVTVALQRGYLHLDEHFDNRPASGGDEGSRRPR
jgi:DNA-binding NarL/FixJ family response regulator